MSFGTATAKDFIQQFVWTVVGASVLSSFLDSISTTDLEEFGLKWRNSQCQFQKRSGRVCGSFCWEWYWLGGMWPPRKIKALPEEISAVSFMTQRSPWLPVPK